MQVIDWKDSSRK